MAREKQSAPNAPTPEKTTGSRALALPSKATTASTTATIADGAGQPLTERQAKILEERGLNLEVLARLGWRSGRDGFIEIPYWRDGVEVNCKTRSIEGEKRFHQVEGGQKCFYNVDALKEVGGGELVITEGEMDCVAALQCGYLAVSVPDGAPKVAIGDRNSVKYDYLNDIPASVTRIILAVDSDSAGVNLMNDIALRLGKHRCLWVKYPVGCKDLNDALMKYGEAGVRQTINRAKYVRVSGLYKLSELPPLPQFTAYDVGIPALEKHLKLRQADFSVVTGIPSHGKSTLANNIAYNMAKTHGWHVCFASFEQPPQTEHRDALTTLHGKKPYYSQSAAERAAADKWIDENMSFIAPDDDEHGDFDLVWLMDAMAAAVTRYGAKLIVIDPWNELDHAYDQREVSLTQYVGSAIKSLKRFAKKFMVHVMVIAHPAKMKKDKDGEYPIPTAYDISDSAHWYNKAEQVIVVHRQQTGNTLVRVAKSRYHNKLGKPGDVELVFSDYDYQFREPL